MYLLIWSTKISRCLCMIIVFLWRIIKSMFEAEHEPIRCHDNASIQTCLIMNASVWPVKLSEASVEESRDLLPPPDLIRGSECWSWTSERARTRLPSGWRTCRSSSAPSAGSSACLRGGSSPPGPAPPPRSRSSSGRSPPRRSCRTERGPRTGCSSWGSFRTGSESARPDRNAEVGFHNQLAWQANSEHSRKQNLRTVYTFTRRVRPEPAHAGPLMTGTKWFKTPKNPFKSV